MVSLNFHLKLNIYSYICYFVLESHKDIINKIKRLKVENKLHALCDDQYSVSEAARLALDGLST